MRFVIVTAGSMGDVAPYTDVALRLEEAGHDVAIVTHERFAHLANDCGVGFHPLKGDPAVLGGQVDASDADSPAFEPGLRALPRNLRLAATVTRDYAHDLAAAIQDSGADVLLLSATVAPLAWHVAEGVGTPSVGLYLQPAHPSRELPPPHLSRSLGPRLNRSAARLSDAAIDTWVSRATTDLRRELGLPPLSPGAMRRRLEAGRWPVCYGFSPTVVPRPADWRPGLHVVGYWWPRHMAGWRPPTELVDFLDAGPPPVLVDFGSLGRGEAELLDEVVHSALRRACVRGVVRSGWAGLTTDGDDAISVGDVDHAWLMPRVAAVVHHTGAGTTAATLRAGVPSIPVPLGIDSRFWVSRLGALGVSPGHLPAKRLSPDDLAAALRQVTLDPSYRRRAETVSQRIETEDGAGRVVDIVHDTLALAPS
jgi:sterol 3beta-glucosyltransferase